MLVVTPKGVVERHVDRGVGEPSFRARRAAEDLDSRAGSLMKKGPISWYSPRPARPGSYHEISPPCHQRTGARNPFNIMEGWPSYLAGRL